MFVNDFIMGAGPQLDPSGFQEAGFADDIGAFMNSPGVGYGHPAGGYPAGGFPGGGLNMLFGRAPYGMSPNNMRALRMWRMGAYFRLALLLFVGLPMACLLLFYGLGAMGDAFGVLTPRLPEQLRPYTVGAHDILVSLRDVVAPYVGKATEVLSGLVGWLRDVISSFASKGAG